MTTYFSTFITGFTPVVTRFLGQELNDLTYNLTLDGLAIYKTSTPVEKIKKLRFINNSYILINQFLHNTPPLKILVKQISNSPELVNFLKKYKPSYKSTFRIVISKENQMIRIDKQVVQQLEEKISQHSQLRLNNSKAILEFWILIRSEGYTFFGLRTTPSVKKPLVKGELRPELAHLLCLISEPNENDIFLDPFCGFGAIPVERAYLPYKQILAGDINPKQISQLRKIVKKAVIKLTLGRWDALDLKTFKKHSVDKIVTDPPWGIYTAKHLRLDRFYHDMLTEFVRVIKPGGIIVVITAQKEIFKDCYKKFLEQLLLTEEYNTLVSGKKAGVYKLVHK